MLRDGRMHHIQLAEGEVGKYAFLPGDPARSELIARHFEEPRLVAQNREYTTYTGRLGEEKVLVTSTGIGGPSTAIAVEELAGLGVHTFIRVGTSGGMQRFCRLGDLAIVEGAVRDEGTSRQYMPLAYPAVADLEVVLALRQAAIELGVRHHVGLAHSKDSYYGQHQPERMPVGPDLKDNWRAWIQGGVLCSEMEAATLFVVAKTLGCRAGGIMLIAGNQGLEVTPEERASVTLDDLIRTAVAGARILVRRDRDAAEANAS